MGIIFAIFHIRTFRKSQVCRIKLNKNVNNCTKESENARKIYGGIQAGQHDNFGLSFSKTCFTLLLSIIFKVITPEFLYCEEAVETGRVGDGLCILYRH